MGKFESILLSVLFILALVGCIATEGWKEVDTEAASPYPTATKVESIPIESPIQRVGSIGIYDFYEYRTDEIICLIGTECGGVNCSIALSCVSK